MHAARAVLPGMGLVCRLAATLSIVTFLHWCCSPSPPPPSPSPPPPRCALALCCSQCTALLHSCAPCLLDQASAPSPTVCCTAQALLLLSRLRRRRPGAMASFVLLRMLCMVCCRERMLQNRLAKLPPACCCLQPLAAASEPQPSPAGTFAAASQVMRQHFCCARCAACNALQ